MHGDRSGPMSTTAIRGGLRRRVTDRSWQLTGAAGALTLGAMAIALAHGPVFLTVAVAIGALLVGAYVLAPAALGAVRSRPAWIVFAGLLSVLVALCGLW